MGGQACVLYAAAPFSKDVDLAVLLDDQNLERLGAALEELEARRIAVPAFDAEYLKRGHAVHFRCYAPGAEDVRLDLMSVMRGVDPFPDLWERRTTAVLPDGTECDVLSMPDLVKAKKTQRDKDWPMIRMLVEQSYREGRAAPTAAQVEFWLKELRTPEVLVDVARRYPGEAERLRIERPVLGAATAGDLSSVAEELWKEERAERERDRIYWEPLRRELEALRREQRLEKGKVDG